MNRLKAGDRVICHVKDMRLVSPYAEHTEDIVLEILASDSTGYFVYVPEHANLHATTKITKGNAKALNINIKFIECLTLYVPDSLIAKVHSHLDGETCTKCKQFYYQASPNQENKSFICWTCRKYPPYR